VNTDPLVQRFREYRNDPVLFVREIFGAVPTDQQVEFLKAVAEENSRVAAKSGHGVGKSVTLAWLILWFMWTRGDVEIPCTAPSGHQLKDVLWGELDAWRMKMPPEMASATVVTQDRVTISGMGRKHYAVARTARKESPEALQGFHARNLMFIIDEAAGVPDEVFVLMQGALTTPNARVVMTGNPSLVTGYFYDAFNRNKEHWTRLTFSCIDSPLVKPEYIQQIIDEYGLNSDIYNVRVLGEFPRQSILQFIPLDIVTMAQARHLDKSQYEYAPVVIGADVSYFGDDRSVIFLRQGLYSERLFIGRDIDTQAYAALIARFAIERESDAVFIDITGWGAGAYDALKNMGLRCQILGVSGAASSTRPEYANKRMESWADMKKWLIDGGTLPPLEDLKDDLVAPEYGYHLGNGRMKLESKQFMKQVRKVPSPDNADALALTFAYPVRKMEIRPGSMAQVQNGRRRSYGHVLRESVRI